MPVVQRGDGRWTVEGVGGKYATKAEAEKAEKTGAPEPKPPAQEKKQSAKR